MKGDVGMSPHEKEGEQEDAYTKTGSHSTPSLHLCLALVNYVAMCVFGSRVTHQRSDTMYSRTVFPGVQNSVVRLL